MLSRRSTPTGPQELGRVGAYVAFAMLLALAAPGGLRAALALAQSPGTDFLFGAALSEIMVANTTSLVTPQATENEGRYRQLLDLYDILFSPDSAWLTYVLDAVPKGGGGHQYYVYMLDTKGERRELVLETKIGPGLDCSFAWLDAKTPGLFWPDYPTAVVRMPPAEGPPWQSCVKVKGQDPRPRPRAGGVAYRQVSGEAASLRFLPPGADSEPQPLSAHCSVFGPLAWAPDGSRLAFLSPEEAEFGEILWTVALGEEPVALSPVAVAEFEWSPTSGAIAVKTQADELIIVAVPSGETLAKVAGARSYTWSPDGSGLAWVAYSESGAEELAYLPVGGGLRRTLLRSQAVGGWDFGPPLFSPDGTKVFVTGAAGRDVSGDGHYYDKADRSLFCCDLASGSVTAAPLDGSAVRPVPCEDGRYAVMVVENTSGSCLWGVDLATGHAYRWGKAPVDLYAYELAWSPNGQLVAYEDNLSLKLSQLGVGPS